MIDPIIPAPAGQYATLLRLDVDVAGAAVVIAEQPAIVAWAVTDSHALHPITTAARMSDDFTMLLVADGDGRLRDTDGGAVYADIAAAQIAFKGHAVEWATERSTAPQKANADA